MVGVAGALLAILSNLNGVADLIGYPCLKAVLFLLVLSLVFGVLQRVVAYPVQLSLQAEIDGEGHVMAVAKAHEEDEQKIRDMAERNGIEVDASINVLRAITSYYSLMPQPYRWWLGRQIQKIITDNDYMRRKLIRGVIRQSLYTFGQLALALAALMLVMLNI